MSPRPPARPAPTLIYEVYTAADRAALPARRVRLVEAIASASSVELADRHAATALGFAATWIDQSETTEGHALIRAAFLAHAAYVQAWLDSLTTAEQVTA